jgi:c(7)-type cytochrome triheme protein
MQKMRSRQHAAERSEMVAVSRSSFVSKRLILAAIILCSISAMALFNRYETSAVSNQPAAWRQPDSLNSANPTSTADYSKFSHKSPVAHDFVKPEKCGSCHRRKDGSLTPRFPVHKDCTGCHLVQFTNPAASDNPICTICHTREGLNSANAPTKSFPRLRTFTADFDHAQHLRGTESARPAEGCAACHTRALRGVAETIPARLGAHQTCYECHSPGKSANNLSSCGSCHKDGGYSPTSIAARSYRVGFSHADHGPRERLTCESCHNVLGRGLPRAKQVSSIAPALHRSTARARSCMTCHNGQRAFGDTRPDFNDCKRCHKGLTFKI